jgi:hypothetical protein
MIDDRMMDCSNGPFDHSSIVHQVIASSPSTHLMSPDDRLEFLKILRAHADTIAVCEACATTTRDLAGEVKRGGVPAKEALTATVDEAERVLADLAAVRAEVDRLIKALA